MEVRDEAVVRLHCEPPLSAKVRCEPDGWRTLWLVSSGATILEGDELRISLQVRGCARLRVRSVAAQLAHPCLDGGWGTLDVEADVGDRSRLDWRPEPVIVAGGAGYRATMAVRVAAGNGAALRWTDELLLGRTGECASTTRVDMATSVDADGHPRWRDGLASGPGWLGPAVLDGARYVASSIVIPCSMDVGGPNGAAGPPLGRGWLPLAGGGWSQRVLDADATRGRSRLAAVLVPEAQGAVAPADGGTVP